MPLELQAVLLLRYNDLLITPTNKAPILLDRQGLRSVRQVVRPSVRPSVQDGKNKK